MADAKQLANHRFRVLRSGDNAEDGPYTLLCVVQGKGVTRSNTFSEAMIPNCDQPNVPPKRSSVKTGSSWTANFSGILFASLGARGAADCDAEDPRWYEFRVDPADGVGAGAERGLIFFENLEKTSADGGHVTFTVQARGQGELKTVA
jgi:hypothetical protein